MLDTKAALEVIGFQLDVEFLSEEQREVLRDRFCQAFSAKVLQKITDFQNLNAAPDLSCLTIRQLKNKASQLQIPGYGAFTKAELVAAIAAAELG